MPRERRKYPRYIPRKAAYIVVKPHFQRLGRVLEISMGSLSFEYLAQEGKRQSWNPVDLFLSEPFFYLPDISCRVAYDKEVDGGPDFPHGFALRRCGVQFVGLTLEHRSKLAYFLKNYAIRCEDGVSPLPVHEEVPIHQIACPDQDPKDKPSPANSGPPPLVLHRKGRIKP